MTIREHDVIVFQGDSVTDADRDRSDPAGLGRGYPALLAAEILASRPHLDLAVHNRGISGNRTKDLLGRWDVDCLDLKPTIVSILIGINNVWRRYDSADPTPAETFRAEYHELLPRTRDADVREIIVLEPFLLPVPADRRGWREDLDPKITICRDLAAEFGAHYVPLDGIFNAAASRVSPAYWAPDGVHPSVAGHGLIARSWLGLLT
jgi:lysophospholipase L1-like esterase